MKQQRKSDLAAKVFDMIAAPTTGVSVHTFNVNGDYLKTVEGQSHFVTTADVSKLLLLRAAEAKQMIEESR